MANPALNEKVFERSAEEAGWAQATDAYGKPAYRGVVAGEHDAMTLNGVVWSSATLIVLVLAAAVFGWNSVTTVGDSVELPGWVFLALIGGLGVAMLTIFKPPLARFTGPVYALVEGALLGAISKVYNVAYDGIVLHAVELTLGVFVMMLVLFATHAIRVTDKLRTGVMAATGAIFLVYMADLVIRLFGGHLPLLNDSSALGIGISLLIVGIAAFRLLLDFDLIEKGVEAGAPRYMEWYCAFGLLVTLVWLYLELLRLLAKLQGGGRR
jgi:uncharacterized YccA/Bax inhibitor family protein